MLIGRVSTRTLALLAVALAACNHDDAIVPNPPRVFTGTYSIQTIDDAALPVVIVTGFGGRSMNVQQGQLTFPDSFFSLDITGPLNGSGNPVTLGSDGPYSVVIDDSLHSTFGVSGRVWQDSATLTTRSFTLTGAH